MIQRDRHTERKTKYLFHLVCVTARASVCVCVRVCVRASAVMDNDNNNDDYSAASDNEGIAKLVAIGLQSEILYCETR